MGEQGLSDDLEDAFQNYISSNVAYNYPGYASPDYDRLFDAARVARDPAEQARLFHAAEAQMMADMPIVPLDNQVSNVLVHQRVKGWRADVMYPMSRWLSVDR
jgi:oligopeptide transport system substrate-binding protein